MVGPRGGPDGVAGDRRGGGGRGHGGQGEPGAAAAGQRRADAQDMFLAGREATVEAVFLDVDGNRHLAVTLDEDPAADLQRWHGRYLYFSPDEVEPLSRAGAHETLVDRSAPVSVSFAEPRPRVLVAGVGNVFLGDDGFGVEVARRLAEASGCPAGSVGDFGIRGVHLAYELLEGYEAAILVDAAPRGGGTGHGVRDRARLDGEPDPAVQDGSGCWSTPTGWSRTRCSPC